MKKKKNFKWLFLGLFVGFLLIGYLLLSLYYNGGFDRSGQNQKFLYGTWINGIYCTGKSAAEVNELLKAQVMQTELTVEDIAGNIEKIQFSEEEFEVDFSEEIQTLLEKQSPFLWFAKLSTKNYEISPEYTIEDKLLYKKVKSLSIVQQGLNLEEPKAEIVKTSDKGYVLEDNLKGAPDADEIIKVVIDALRAGQSTVVLSEDCYMDRKPTAQVQKTLSLWLKIESLQKCGIIYKIGDEQVSISEAEIAEWFQLDEEGQFVLDKENNPVLKKNCYRDYIFSLADRYDTYNKPREFLTTRGDVVTIEKGTYGNKIDKEAEIEYLSEAFLEKRREIRIPKYEQEALYPGKDDLGDTYVEIDLTQQKMYYYVDGEISLETPIVSGNMQGGYDTPERVCYIYQKQTDRILRGPGYASPVDYWMPVYGNIGIHDASWRSEFGGEIYKTNGSHGCINTPFEAMKALFEEVEIGTPVIMFY